jgi:hypothetical protein
MKPTLIFITCKYPPEKTEIFLLTPNKKYTQDHIGNGFFGHETIHVKNFIMDVLPVVHELEEEYKPSNIIFDDIDWEHEYYEIYPRED